MEKNRKGLFSYLSLILFSIFLYSCSMPKIVVLKDPLSAEEHNNLGVAYEKKGILDLAEKEYNKAIRKKPDWDIPYFNLGNIYYKKGNLKKALQFYKKAVELNPDNTDALNNMAYVYYLLKDYNKAYYYIKKALSKKLKSEYLQTMKEIEEKIYESD
ncbi:tetratricopeptide repeat protein [Persephonella atlantica]|uniref:tetratricopeptide repeat protein n=1 Tax=Persephonella atlantica TaxID=2699429 RepID=UPI00190C0179|nr:tetratricopeptide repeat protein [Persephonella atlantica]